MMRGNVEDNRIHDANPFSVWMRAVLAAVMLAIFAASGTGDREAGAALSFPGALTDRKKKLILHVFPAIKRSYSRGASR